MKIGFSVVKDSKVSKIVLYFSRKSTKNYPAISHAFPILGEIHGVQLGFSADEFMVDIIDVNTYRKPGHILRVYEVPDRYPMTHWVPKLIEDYNKKNYGWFDIVWFAWRWFRRLFKDDWNGKNPIETGIFCSEISLIALQRAGYNKELAHMDPNSIDPAELEEIVRKLPNVKLVEVYDR